MSTIVDHWGGMRAISDSFFDGDKITVPPGVLEHLGIGPRTLASISIVVHKHRDGRVTLVLHGPSYDGRRAPAPEE